MRAEEFMGRLNTEAAAAEKAAMYNLAEIRKLEIRIKHLEAVVYDEGAPPTREDCVP